MPNQSDPTQNPNPVSPPVDPPTSQAATPPMPPVIFPQSDLPPLSPDFQNLPETNATTTPTEQPSIQPVTDDTGSSAPPDMSSVTPKARKKFGGGKIIATILGIVILVGGVGAGILLMKQPQLFKQKASTGTAGQDTCQLVTVTATEDPNCPQLKANPDAASSGTNSVSTYKTSFTITNNDGSPHTVAYRTYGSHCLDPYGDFSPGYYVCNENTTLGGSETEPLHTEAIPPGGSVTITVEKPSTALSGGAPLACGSYQTDLAIINIDNRTPACTGRVSGWFGAAWGGCQTGIDCPTRPNLCTSSTVDKTTLAPGESVVMSSVSNSSANNYYYSVYNVDNPYNANNPKPVCVTSNNNVNVVTTEQDTCPAGTHHLIFKDPNTTSRTTGSTSVKYEDLFVIDKNWSDKQVTHVQINAYFQVTGGEWSTPQPSCVAWVSATTIAPSCVSVKAYDADGTDITGTLSSLAIGDTVDFCVDGSGAIFNKAQFMINSDIKPVLYTSSSSPKSGGLCQSYKISTADTTVKAKIGYTINGVEHWVGEDF